MKLTLFIISLLLSVSSIGQVTTIQIDTKTDYYGKCNVLYYAAPVANANTKTVVFIPGRGNHEKTGTKELEEKVGPLQFVTKNGWRPDFNIIVIQPSNRTNPFLYEDGTIDKVKEQQYYEFVKFMLEYFVKPTEHPVFPKVNSNRIYMTGLSLGAHYIHSYLRRMKNGTDIKPQATVTMSIAMTESYTGYPNFQNLPMWGLIGDEDDTVGPEDTKIMKTSSFFTTMSGFWMDMKKANWRDKRLTIYEGGHGDWQYFYNPANKIPEVTTTPYFQLVTNPVTNATSMTIYDWMLQFGPNESVLPVTFHTFKVQYINTETILQWSTANETNNSHFIIERSEDGIHFQEVGRVESKARDGNSSGILNYIFKLFSK